jgi:hypothetical protein
MASHGHGPKGALCEEIETKLPLALGACGHEDIADLAIEPCGDDMVKTCSARKLGMKGRYRGDRVLLPQVGTASAPTLTPGDEGHQPGVID